MKYSDNAELLLEQKSDKKMTNKKTITDMYTNKSDAGHAVRMVVVVVESKLTKC